MTGNSSFFSVKTQFENVGDALINRQLINLASRSSEVMVDLSRCPDWFAKNFLCMDGAVTCSSSTYGLFMRLLFARISGRKCFYFLSPGGYVGEKTLLESLSGLVNTIVILALALSGVRVCLVGASYERIGARHRALLKLRSHFLHRHLVRDKESLYYARSIGLRVGGLMPDLAFGCHAFNVDKNSVKTKIALSFRTDQTAAQGIEFLNLVREIDSRFPEEVPLKIIVQVERDEAGLRNALDIVLRRPVEFVKVFSDINDCFEAYRDCRVLISNRLHAMLIAIHMGCHPIGFVDEHFNRKIWSLFFDLDLSDRIFYLPVKDAVTKAIELWDASVNYEHLIESQTSELTSVIADVFE